MQELESNLGKTDWRIRGSAGAEGVKSWEEIKWAGGQGELYATIRDLESSL